MPNGYKKFLKEHKSSKGQTPPLEITNTIIGNEEAGVYGASLHIGGEEYTTFCELYCTEIFQKRQKEHMTERQLSDAAGDYGPILIDLDFRYSTDITTRQHTNDDIENIIYCYLESLNDIINFTDSVFSVYVFEKQNVNVIPDKAITKDGIHIIIGIKMSHEYQRLLRLKVLEKLPDILDDIPITNTWSDVIDEGITQGSVAWQMYGSRKPSHQAYEMTQHRQHTYSEETSDFGEAIQMDDRDDYKSMPHFIKISARFTGHPDFAIKDSAVVEVANKFKKRAPRNLLAVQQAPVTSQQLVQIDYSHIDSMQKLEDQMSLWASSLNSNNDYKNKELFDLIMILPEEYYGPGSYNKWLKVGFALKSVGEQMLLPWLRFCAQSSSFDFCDICTRIADWDGYNTGDCNQITELSIIYWARTSNKEQFDTVCDDTLSRFIDDSISENGSDYSIALVLYCKYKFDYVCVSPSKNKWYEFVDNRWKFNEEAVDLQLKLPTHIFKLYLQRSQETLKLIGGANDVKRHCNDPVEAARLDNAIIDFNSKQKAILNIMKILRSNTGQRGIMAQAKLEFYDQRFLEELNKNVYLMGFKNGVYDFAANQFREGRPDDYITLSTNNAYYPDNTIKNSALIRSEIIDFMKQLFPDHALCEYMWEHMSSVLIGINHNQTFNIYTGAGSNGKSKLVDLMSLLLGDYKGVVPASLLTQKRMDIGKASPEIFQLIGRRYAVIQEPSKGDTINEGTMKEITGGDALQGRALYGDTVTFTPQFKLVVCTNNLMEIKSNDDGTWRRIRVCPFKSKFVCDADYDSSNRFHFKINMKINDRFKEWLPVLMNMLIERVHKNKSIVQDCSEVLDASNRYRNEQDYISRFITEKIRSTDNEKDCIKKRALGMVFKSWYTLQTGKQPSKLDELYATFERKYGTYPKKGWHHIKIEDEDDDDEDIVDP